MYKHLFSKRLSNKLYKQWNIAIDSFTEYYSDLKINKLLIDLKGIHGFPMICGKYLYKVEILNESQNIFNRKERLEILCQRKLFNICYPIEILSNKNSVCYKYEYFTNGDLLEYIYKHQLRYDEIDDVLTQCLKIVHRIHRESYLHYDIKPENIFVKGSRRDKTIVLGDIETMRHTSENIDGTTLGTNTYHPPKNKNIYYNHLDIYAFGKTIYKVLCIQCFPDLEDHGIDENKIEKWLSTPYSSCLNIYKNIENENTETNKIVEKWLNIAYDCCVLNEFNHTNNKNYPYFFVGDIYKKYK
jgi:serine/threonine protein kinase